MIVVDTNVISYFLIPTQFSDLAQRAARMDAWCAPLLWRSEFRNVLTNHFRAKILTVPRIRELMDKAERLFWGREFSVRSSSVLTLIERSNRSAYDCEFIALAQDFRIPLITTDEPIIREFPEIAIHLRDFVGRA